MTGAFAAAGPATRAPLPYGRLMTASLRPMQRGFLVLNRGFMAPLIRARLGWLVGSPLGGHYLLLVTRGRRSGLRREAPLGYVVRNGAVDVVAGYGRSTPWYLNLLAHPEVEVILPTRRFRATAAPVDDPAEWAAAYRALIASFGLIGRGVAGDIRDLDDETLRARHGALPVVRLAPVDGEQPVVAGPFDPGGRGWIVSWTLTAVSGVLAARAIGRLRRAAGDLRASAVSRATALDLGEVAHHLPRGPFARRRRDVRRFQPRLRALLRGRAGRASRLPQDGLARSLRHLGQRIAKGPLGLVHSWTGMDAGVAPAPSPRSSAR
jgi:deazaflavin-dependent oxidoreductase (nitroreductase family)